MKVEYQDLALEKVEIPDLRRLKELSERLQLSPKRESVIQWENDLKELQSEGIYPIPVKAKQKITFSEPELSPGKIVDIPLDKEADKSKTNKQTNNDSKETTISESSSNTTATQCVTSTIENLRRQNKLNKNSFTQVQNQNVKNASLREDGSKIDVAKLRKPSASKYFRQRSIEDCQSKIKHYAMRLDENEKSSENSENNKENVTTTERYRRIGLALERIRTDLLDMRIHDNNLARELLDGRHKLVELRAQKTCDEHATMLDDFTWELEIEEELTEQLRSSDLPSTFLRGPNSLLKGSSPLRLIGISRMTLDAKRFSVI